MSETASGTFAKMLTYSLRQTGQQVRIQRKQKDRNTGRQQVQRTRFLSAKEVYGEQEIGGNQLGNLLLGGKKIDIMKLEENRRAPQFAAFVGEYLRIFQ